MFTQDSHVKPAVVQSATELQPRFTGDEEKLFNIFLDFETYYDDEYSLTKMTPVEYILDPRFEVLGCAVVWGASDPFWLGGPELADWFEKVPWSAARVISHNALFDACILAWRYGINPARWACTLSLARASFRSKLRSVSLASCAKHIGLEKGSEVLLSKGWRFANLLANPDFYLKFQRYACNDAEICCQLWEWLAPSPHQAVILDMCIRMGTEPQFALDPIVLHAHLNEVLQQKQALLDVLQLDDRDALMSDEQLANMLRSIGVEPPMKKSPTSGQFRYAFARTDKDFLDLLDDPDPRVQAIVAARLGHKTTIEETRTQRFINISRLKWPIINQPMMPVPLAYSGAHTHRFSGDWKLNLQNLGRNSKLRQALKAPPGKMVVSGDASQIEARFLATLAGQDDLVEAFREGRDVYAEFASDVFGRKITKQTFPTERQVGKVGILQLGYGASYISLQRMLRVNGNIQLSIEECQRIVNVYRSKYDRIVSYWSTWDNRINSLANDVQFTMLEGQMAMAGNRILLSGGNAIHYENLRQEPDDRGRMGWIYDYAGKTKKLYGSKATENAVQALAFACVMENAVRVQHITQGAIKLALQGHDELVYVVDEAIADDLVLLLRHAMACAPWWLPTVPLAAEAGKGKTYGDVKKH